MAAHNPAKRSFSRSQSIGGMAHHHTSASLTKSSVQGWPSGIPTDSEDSLRFAELSGVRLMIEKFPLAKVNEAYARSAEGACRKTGDQRQSPIPRRPHDN